MDPPIKFDLRSLCKVFSLPTTTLSLMNHLKFISRTVGDTCASGGTQEVRQGVGYVCRVRTCSCVRTCVWSETYRQDPTPETFDSSFK